MIIIYVHIPHHYPAHHHHQQPEILKLLAQQIPLALPLHPPPPLPVKRFYISLIHVYLFILALSDLPPQYYHHLLQLFRAHSELLTWMRLAQWTLQCHHLHPPPPPPHQLLLPPKSTL